MDLQIARSVRRHLAGAFQLSACAVIVSSLMKECPLVVTSVVAKCMKSVVKYILRKMLPQNALDAMNYWNAIYQTVT